LHINRSILFDAWIPFENCTDYCIGIVIVAKICGAFPVFTVHPEKIAGSEINYTNVNIGVAQLGRRTRKDIDDGYIAGNGLALRPAVDT